MKVDYVCEASNEAISLLYMIVGMSHDWEQNLWNRGLHDGGSYLGKDKEKPNMVSYRFICINQKVIMFYEGVSMFVDHSEIEQWLSKNYKDVPEINVDVLALSLKEGKL